MYYNTVILHQISICSYNLFSLSPSPRTLRFTALPLERKKTPLSSRWHTPTRTLTEISPDPPFPPSCASAIKETLPQGTIIYWSSPPRSLATYITCTNYLQHFLATQPFDCQPEIHTRLDLDPYKLQPHLNRAVLFAPNLFAVSFITRHWAPAELSEPACFRPSPRRYWYLDKTVLSNLRFCCRKTALHPHIPHVSTKVSKGRGYSTEAATFFSFSLSILPMCALFFNKRTPEPPSGSRIFSCLYYNRLYTGCHNVSLGSGLLPRSMRLVMRAHTSISSGEETQLTTTAHI